MVMLLVYIIIGCLLIYCLRLILPLTGLPAQAINAICILLAIVFLLWLIGGAYGGKTISFR